MRRAAMLAYAGALWASAGCAAHGAPFVPDEVIVRFRAEVNAAGAARVAEALGLRVKKPLGPAGAYLLGIVDGTPVAQAIARLRERPEVLDAEPNRITRLEPVGPPVKLPRN